MGWVSPTGHNDPGVVWVNPELAYDESLITYAATALTTGVWTAFLGLTHAALNCDKIQFVARVCGTKVDSIDVDVYYDGDWHHVYEGAYTNSEWVEKPIPAGTKSVTAAQIRFHGIVDDPYEHLLGEFDFWEVPAAVGRSFGFIMG